MAIHPPKTRSSLKGFGDGNNKQIKFISDDLAICTEIWNKMEKPFVGSGVIIANTGYKWVTRWETGKPYIIYKFYDQNNVLVGIYSDICHLVKRVDGGFEFEDLYLDVWQVPGQDPVILDEDELMQAVEAGYVTSEEADNVRKAAAHVINKLKNDPEFLNF